ncbi:MAG: hypothetical protein J6T88_09070 [Bacteroidales bacterium]|nr:hypothetical protein [Bacteroidales bacterium]
MKRNFFILALTIVSSLSLFAQNKKVAVWDTKCTDNSITSMQRVMVRGGMEAAVANAPGYTGFDRASFDAIIKEHNFQRSGAVNDNDIRRLGEMAGVQYIIVPEAMAQGGDFYIIVKMLDVESGEFGAAYEELCTTSAADIKRACAKLGSQLFGTSYSGGNSYSSNSSSSSNTYNKYSLDYNTWNSMLSKMLTNVTTRFDNGDLHIGEANGLEVYYFKEYNDLYLGYSKNGKFEGPGMYIIMDDKGNFKNMPNSMVYFGQYQDHKRQEGWVFSHKGKLLYTGKFSDGKPTSQYPTSMDDTQYNYLYQHAEFVATGSGDLYIGILCDGKRCGTGLYIWQSGDAWYGQWNDDVQNGYGIYMYYNGTYIVGEWKDGKRVK